MQKVMPIGRAANGDRPIQRRASYDICSPPRWIFGELRIVVHKDGRIPHRRIALAIHMGRGICIAEITVFSQPSRLKNIAFSSAVVPEQWRFWYTLNPIVGDGFRWCVLGGQSPLDIIPGFLLSLCIVALLFWIGIAHFWRTERSFADLI